MILGSGVGDRLMYKNDPPGDVRAFDARTGKQVWTFHTIPQPGEFGHETWQNDAWKFTGHTNVWAPFTLDAERGLVYLPVSTPSNDYYGGRRLGANLFAESLVCLDARTGRRKWHYQIVHHGLWDYDPASPPNLVTIRVNGKRIDAVVQLTKQGFAFVFDRVTGMPVWPIEERPVPQSDVPGEQSSPTQPFPTRPPPFTPQGTSLDDAFDLTPELKAAAQEEMKKFRLGPVYTPPSMEGTLVRPGVWGGANWGGGAFDPETGMLYLKTVGLPQVFRIQKRDPDAPTTRPGEVDADYVNRGPVGLLQRGVAADQAAVRASGGDRPEQGRHRLARAVRGLAGGARTAREDGGQGAGEARRAGAARVAGDQERAHLRRRRRPSVPRRGQDRRPRAVVDGDARDDRHADDLRGRRTAVRGGGDRTGRRGDAGGVRDRALRAAAGIRPAAPSSVTGIRQGTTTVRSIDGAPWPQAFTARTRA